MVGLQLIAGAFLIIAGCCVIARAIGYSPEESARKRIEQCEEMLPEMEDRLRRIQAPAETPQSVTISRQIRGCPYNNRCHRNRSRSYRQPFLLLPVF